MDAEDSRGEAMDWKPLLAYITGTVDQELLLRNEYLVTANRILRNQSKGRLSNSNFGFARSLRLPIDTDLATVGLP
jgi:hypothetical protein